MNWETRFEQKPLRTLFSAALAVIGLGFVLYVVLGALGFISLPFRTATTVAEKTLDADNVVYNYEWFKRQYNDVLAMDVKLEAAEQAQASFEDVAGPRDAWKFDDRQEWNRLNAIVLGLRGQRADMVALYNARAKMVNRSIFMDSDVPEELK